MKVPLYGYVQVTLSNGLPKYLVIRYDRGTNSWQFVPNVLFDSLDEFRQYVELLNPDNEMVDIPE